MTIERDLAKCIKIKEIEQPTQRLVINGVEQYINNNVLVICCPSCGRVITQFNQGTTLAMAHKFINENHDKLFEETSYCSSCGQKLYYPTIIESGA